jgi:hypothetical protein
MLTAATCYCCIVINYITNNINRKADKEGSGELSLETFRQVMRESALLRDKDIDQVRTLLLSLLLIISMQLLQY